MWQEKLSSDIFLYAENSKINKPIWNEHDQQKLKLVIDLVKNGQMSDYLN